MNHIDKTIWQRWMTFWEVVLAFVAGLFLFAILNLVSAGLLITLVIACACFAVLALFHFLLWGREFSWIVVRQRRSLEARSHAATDGTATHLDDFVVELNDTERKELMQLLEHSVADAGADADKKHARQELLDKLRMFGA